MNAIKLVTEGEEKMPEEKKPTFDDITKSFYEKCHLNSEGLDHLQCHHCELKTGNGSCDTIIEEVECKSRYIYDVATGKRDIEQPLWNPPKVPEWFKVGTKLWRKAYSDWYVINSIEDIEEQDDNGYPCFNVRMTASDGTEDEAQVAPESFTTEAPFSEAFMNLLGKRRAYHKKLGLAVDITYYNYENNTVYFSYIDNHGVSFAVSEKLDEENFEEVKAELPEWFKVGATLLDEWGNLVEVVDYETHSGCTVYVYYKPKGSEGVEKETSSGKIAYEDMCNGKVFKPVKFRRYDSLNELESLLGKQLRFEREVMGGGSTAIETITSVEYDSFDGDMTINNRPYSFYTEEVVTTIDGRPVGVPVVDEELLNQ